MRLAARCFALVVALVAWPSGCSTGRGVAPAAGANDFKEAGRAGAIRVALYRAPGVGLDAHTATVDALRAAGGFDVRVVTPDDVRTGALAGVDVVVFTGGRGGVQGEALGEDGRQIVRDFVAAGGGYIGVCAGAYLALQGPAEFFKLAIVAGRNLSGDFWQRGEHTAEVREGPHDGAGRVRRLFYANGPVVEPVDHPSIPPFVTLATFVSDFFLPAHGTRRGEMPGSPAILASTYGQGRIILFSPNPVLAAEGETASPEMMLRAVRFVSIRGPLPAGLAFGDVFR
jgi:putative intracellular protease/amidase